MRSASAISARMPSIRSAAPRRDRRRATRSCAASVPTKLNSGWLVIATSIGQSEVGRNHLVGAAANAVVEHIAHLGLVVAEQHDYRRSVGRKPDDQSDGNAV